jgi:hypothetical protein
MIKLFAQDMLCSRLALLITHFSQDSLCSRLALLETCFAQDLLCSRLALLKTCFAQDCIWFSCAWDLQKVLLILRVEVRRVLKSNLGYSR